MRKMFLASAFAAIILVAVAPELHAKKQTIRANGGTVMPSAGIIIDGSYDTRLDTLVPGYKVVSVILVNQSFNIVGLDPEGDKWYVKLSGRASAIPAINSLRQQDPKAWAQLPEGAKDIVGYPLVLPIGAREVFDLFIPDKYDLENFNEIHAYIKSMNTKFEILVTQ